MADSLDDFFAKKDKKRGKDKGKTFLTAEALVRELEEGSKQVEYTARKDNKTSAAIEMLGLDTDDADWRDFEDIEKRDYTGLKIKEISLQDQNDEEMRRLQADQAEGREESTVWKTKDGLSTKDEAATNDSKDNKNMGTTPAPASTANSDSKSDNQPDKEPSQASKPDSSAGAKKDESETGDKTSATNTSTTTTTKKVYVPPGQRNMPIGLEPTKMPKRSIHRTDAPPKLDNEQEFPGLG